MSEKILPFNIDILQLTPQLVQGITPITVLDIFDPNTKNFNDNGLFSTTIFGKVGTKDRMRRFSYIQLNADIIHPIIYKAIIDLKSLHEGILSGKEYATFNKMTGEFEKSNPIEGSTGYTFFLNHLSELKFKTTESSKRDLKIALIEKYRTKCLTNKIVVIPAGLRDFTIDDSGKPTEDEVNGFYRKFLSKNNLLSKSILRSSKENLDNILYSLQDTFNELYAYFKSLLSGKNKLILGKWAARKVYYTTRNVASTAIFDIKDLDDVNNGSTPRMDNVQVGLYQYIKSTLPITIHLLNNNILNNIFNGDMNTAMLINKKTLTREMVTLDSYEIERWLTDRGLEKTITSFSVKDSRSLPIEVMDHYMALVYKPEYQKDTAPYCIFYDIKDANPKWDKKDIYPLTYVEMYYLSIYDDVKNRPITVTRYPITGIGSIFPAWPFLRTTIHVEKRYEVDTENQPTGKQAYQYPVLTDTYYDTVSPSPFHNARMDLDYDGDTISFVALYSEQAKKEVKNLLNSTKYYRDFQGKITYSGSFDTIDYVLKNMTG